MSMTFRSINPWPAWPNCTLPASQYVNDLQVYMSMTCRSICPWPAGLYVHDLQGNMSMTCRSICPWPAGLYVHYLQGNMSMIRRSICPWPASLCVYDLQVYMSMTYNTRVSRYITMIYKSMRSWSCELKNVDPKPWIKAVGVYELANIYQTAVARRTMIIKGHKAIAGRKTTTAHPPPPPSHPPLLHIPKPFVSYREERG